MKKDITKEDSILTAIIRKVAEKNDTGDGLTIVTMDQVAHAIPPEIYETFKTDTNIDLIFSDDGGVMRAAIVIVVGEPGVGKTTVLNDILSRIQDKDEAADILFISSEESLIDRAYNHRKTPTTGDIKTMFLNDYPNGKIKTKKEAIEKALDRGYDIIMIDSFKDCQDKIKLDPDNTMNTSEAETWLINLMVDTASGQNKKGKFTAFLCIQQINKGGSFVGSNSLKHNTTGMVEMRYDKEDPKRRYVAFTKNRRAGSMTNKRVYYTYNEKKRCIEYEEPVDRSEKKTTKPINSKQEKKHKVKKIYRGTGSFSKFARKTS